MDHKTINKIVWWIPFKNIRNYIRNTLIIKNTDHYDENYKYYFLTNEIKNAKLQQEIFLHNVERVEIEIHSYCNRKCWFCPNSIIDRHSQFIELDEKIYLGILKELKKIDYSGLVYFHRYNEPLANMNLLLKRMDQAREYLPKAKLCIFTNADYLTKEYLEELSKYIDVLIMSYYLKNDETYDLDNKIKPYMQNVFSKLDLNINRILTDNETFYFLESKYKNTFIQYRAKNFKENYNSRGGLIYSKNIFDSVGKISCNIASYSINIDYNGIVMACCHLRSDVKEHKAMILGDLYKSNIFEIYTNAKSANVRKYLIKKSIKKSPCHVCYGE